MTFIIHNYGTVNHIEKSIVTVNPNGQVITEGKLRPAEETELV